MAKLTLAEASKIVDTALAAGRKHNFKPLAVVVLDWSGQAVAVKREDNTSLMRTDVANAKAWGCLGMGFGGRELERRSKANPGFFNTLTALAGGRMVPVSGGVLIRNAAGEVVGAVGVSGDISANDEICAVEGIKAAGLVPDTGDPA